MFVLLYVFYCVRSFVDVCLIQCIRVLYVFLCFCVYFCVFMCLCVSMCLFLGVCFSVVELSVNITILNALRCFYHAIFKKVERRLKEKKINYELNHSTSTGCQRRSIGC